MYRAKLHKRESFHSSTIQTLAMALEARDFITEGHSERIESLLEALGETIGMQKGNILDLRLFARFHDIGKVGISDRILFKPETLTTDEWVEMRRHSEIGYRIAKSSI